MTPWWKARKKWQKITIISIVIILLLVGITDSNRIIDSNRTTDLAPLLGRNADEAYKYFDKNTFYLSEVGTSLIHDEPLVMINIKTQRVYSVDLHKAYQNSNDYSICGIKIGDSKDKVTEIIKEYNMTEAYPGTSSEWYYDLPNGFGLWIVFDDNGKVNYISLDD